MSFIRKDNLELFKQSINLNTFKPAQDIIKKDEASLSDFIYLIKNNRSYGFEPGFELPKLLKFMEETFNPNWHNVFNVLNIDKEEFLNFAKKENINLENKDDNNLSLSLKIIIDITNKNSTTSYLNNDHDGEHFNRTKNLMTVISNFSEGNKDKINHYFKEILQNSYSNWIVYKNTPENLEKFIKEYDNILDKNITKHLYSNAVLLNSVETLSSVKQWRDVENSHMESKDFDPNLDLVDSDFINKFETNWKRFAKSTYLTAIGNSSNLVNKLKDQDHNGTSFFEFVLWQGLRISQFSAKNYSEDERNVMLYISATGGKIEKDSTIFKNMADRFAKPTKTVLNAMNSLVKMGVKPVVNEISKEELSHNFLIGLSGALIWPDAGYKRDETMINYLSDENKKIFESLNQLFEKFEFTKDNENKKKMKM